MSTQYLFYFHSVLVFVVIFVLSFSQLPWWLFFSLNRVKIFYIEKKIRFCWWFDLKESHNSVAITVFFGQKWSNTTFKIIERPNGKLVFAEITWNSNSFIFLLKICKACKIISGSLNLVVTYRNSNFIQLCENFPAFALFINTVDSKVILFSLFSFS